jgi:hypothetical protein
MMDINWRIPLVKNLISAEQTPAILFVCSARIKPEAGIQFRILFQRPLNTPQLAGGIKVVRRKAKKMFAK